MPRAAVLGRPIAHSLSPVLHNAAYRALGLVDWSYTAIDCDGAALGPLVRAAQSDWVGYSCTMPVKEAALAFADTASQRAQLVGAANTLVRQPDGAWHAENTDVDGILATVAQHCEVPRRAVILGAGGTARAALAASAAWGLPTVVMLVREPSRAEHAVAAGARLGVRVDVLRFDDPAARESVQGADLVMSTLPQGAADTIAAWGFRRGQAVLDVVYNPWPTTLAARAAADGATVLNGASMLLHQAARQVQLMTGREAPVAVMADALRAAAPAGSLPEMR